MSEEKYILQTCKHCGNKGLLKNAAQHKQHYTDYDDGEVIFEMDTIWRMLECPVCREVSLHKTYSDDSMIDIQGDYFQEESIEYPRDRYDFIYVPESILYYIYELPVKIARMNKKYDLKLENSRCDI